MVMENNQLVVDSTFDRIQARNGLSAKHMSQLNKLLPVLELAGKKEVDPELQQQKLEQKRDRLLVVQELLAKTVKSFSTLATVDHSKKMKKLTLGIKRMQSILDEGVPQGMSKPVKKAANEMLSIRDAVYLQLDMSASEYQTLALSECLTECMLKIKAHEGVMAKFHNQRQGVDEAAEEELRMYADFSKIMESVADSTQAEAYSKLKTEPFVVTRMPVIPMPKKGALDPAKFSKAGFKCESLAGYPMLRHQLVVGVNRSMIDLTDKEREKFKGKPMPREMIFKAATKVKRIVERQTGQKLFFVDERPYGAQGGSWFWLMTEPQVNAFASACPGGSIQLLNFGFAC